MSRLGDRAVALAAIPAAAILIAHLTGVLDAAWADMEAREQHQTACWTDGAKWHCQDIAPVRMAWRS
jgi:hypothetical protein